MCKCRVLLRCEDSVGSMYEEELEYWKLEESLIGKKDMKTLRNCKLLHYGKEVVI